MEGSEIQQEDQTGIVAYRRLSISQDVSGFLWERSVVENAVCAEHSRFSWLRYGAGEVPGTDRRVVPHLVPAQGQFRCQSSLFRWSFWQRYCVLD